ncbi:MAG: 6-phosphofructokinase [Bacteroidaceae bacterium]|nr:6-phosphofructokinase [Bacteroidaceae bacterium]
MRIGILTSGGDCPGINATIRGVCKTAIHSYGMEVIGIHSGFKGLLDLDYEELNKRSLTGLLTMGGTILGTSREKPYKKKQIDSSINKPALLAENVRKLGLDAVVCIGGNGTQKTANHMAKAGLPVIGIPKTIDNDIYGTDICFGFQTAVSIATEAIDRLHSTASAHQRVMVIEVMGHKAGWIALYSGMAGGGDVILLPERAYSMKNICNSITTRMKRGKNYAIVVVAEGLPIDDSDKRAGEYIARQIERMTGVETRETVLGYTQRGGSPCSSDRILATRMGSHAVELIVRKEFGRMVAVSGKEITSVPLNEVAGITRLLPQNHELILQGEKMGICFG